MSGTPMYGVAPGSGALAYAAAGLILAAGLIHLALTPEHLDEATYLGLLFLADFAGAATAAFGILRGRRWGWALGALVAGGAYALYFVNGTVGLPGVEEGHLIEPLGLLAKAVEALFLLLCAFALTRGFAPSGRLAVLAATIVALVALPAAALSLAPGGAEGGRAQHTVHHDQQRTEPALEPTSPAGASGGVSEEERAARAEADCRLAIHVAQENMSPQEADAFSELLADMIRTMEDPSWAEGNLRNAALDHLGVPRYPECKAGGE
jgi:hypothetical protein